MTDAELSLKIAEYLEPKPSRWTGSVGAIHQYKCWSKCYSTENGNHWIPRDMPGDSLMTIWLLSQMHIKNNLVISFDRGPLRRNKSGMCIDGLDCGILYFTRGESFGRCVAEAFAKSKGLI